MELKGEYLFQAPPERMWACFTEQSFLRQIIPGCKELEEVEPDHFRVHIEIGLAGVKGKYTGAVRLSEKDPPRSYRMAMDGKGLPGWVKAEGKVELGSEGPASTRVSYAGQFQVGGLIAGIGQRMLEGVARLMVKQFFQTVEKQVLKGP